MRRCSKYRGYFSTTQRVRAAADSRQSQSPSLESHQDEGGSRRKEMHGQLDMRQLLAGQVVNFSNSACERASVCTWRGAGHAVACADTKH